MPVKSVIRGSKVGEAPFAAWVSLVAFAVSPAFAVEATGSTSTNLFTLVPSVTLKETISDNYRLTTTDRRAEAITEVSAGLHFNSNAGRVKGSLDYTLTSRLAIRDSEANGLHHSLAAALSAELIDNKAFVDARASIAPQPISVFGKRSFGSSVENSNQTDVLNYTISPYVRGVLGGQVQYEARLDQTGSLSSASNAANSSTTTVSATLSGGNVTGLFGWSMSASHLVSDFSDGEQTESDRFRAILTRAFGPEVTVSLIAGLEVNNFAGSDKTSYANKGMQVRWIPNQRTSLSALYERRFFGNAHAVDFAYRTPRTTWTFSDSRDISTSPDRVTRLILGDSYNLFFVQFASIEPDPVRRDLLVRAFLAANGINPNALVTGDFLGSGVTVQRTQSLSLALRGVRSSLTVRSQFGNSARINRLLIGANDLIEATRVRQRDVTVDLSHRLTPTAAAALTLARLRTSGIFEAQGTTLTSLSATWSNMVNARLNLSAGARYVEFSSATQPYTERAVFATVRMQF